jgi:hypothetical protein
MRDVALEGQVTRETRLVAADGEELGGRLRGAADPHDLVFSEAGLVFGCEGDGPHVHR